MATRGRRKLPPVDKESPILWGAEAIGAHLGRTASQIYALHHNGRLPTRKVGAIIVAKKADLDNPGCWPGQTSQKE